MQVQGRYNMKNDRSGLQSIHGLEPATAQLDADTYLSKECAITLTKVDDLRACH